jgi:hypothetical protein
VDSLPDDDIGTTRWFGLSWGAPVCDPRTHIEIPIGVPCGLCGIAFRDGDQGISLPMGFASVEEAQAFIDSGQRPRVDYHQECQMMLVLGSERVAKTYPSITCPRCAMTSYNPNDIRQGYCGNCHDWTQPGA